MKLIRPSTVLFASLLCTAFAANAQTTSTTTAAGSRSNFSLIPGTQQSYVGFNIGEASYANGDDFGFKIYAGSRIADQVRLEFGYVNFGKVGRFGGEAEAYGANFSLIGHIPVTEVFNLYGRVGTTYSRSKQSAGIPETASGRDNGFGFAYGIGVGYNLTPQVELVGEWERHRVDFAGGRESISLYTVGVRYTF